MARDVSTDRRGIDSPNAMAPWQGAASLSHGSVATYPASRRGPGLAIPPRGMSDAELCAGSAQSGSTRVNRRSVGRRLQTTGGPERDGGGIARSPRASGLLRNFGCDLVPAGRGLQPDRRRRSFRLRRDTTCRHATPLPAAENAPRVPAREDRRRQCVTDGRAAG